MKQIVSTSAAPAAIGPYSQAVVFQGMVFVSGQIPLDAQTGELVEGDVVAQTRKVLKNLSAILEQAGSSLEAVLKTTVYLKDMSDFPRMNEVYAEFFGASLPARATVEVSRLPKDVSVEIDAVAAVS